MLKVTKNVFRRSLLCQGTKNSKLLIRNLSACEHVVIPRFPDPNLDISNSNIDRKEAQKLALQALLKSLTCATANFNAMAVKRARHPKPTESWGRTDLSLDGARRNGLSISIEKGRDGQIIVPKADSTTEVQLHRAIRRGHTERAMILFNQAIQTNTELRLNQIVSLFFMLADTAPIEAYTVLKEFHKHPQCRGLHNGMYRRICKSVSLIDPKKYFRQESKEFIESLILDVEKMDLDTKSNLFPIIVTSLVAQRSVQIGEYALPIYQKMLELDISMSSGWLINLLSLSKFQRQDILPFHDILARIVERNAQVDPPIVLRAVHNLFPFSDSQACESMLRSLLVLIKQDISSRNKVRSRYRIDMGTIDSMSVSSVRSGNSKIILLLWEIIELLGYTPSESVYENTIITFAISGNTSSAFDALQAMEGDEFPAKRALVRNFSRVLRSKPGRLTGVSQMFLKSCRISIGSFNTILSAFSGMGRIEQAMDFLEQASALGLEPDVESYSFAIEALGKDLLRRRGAIPKALKEKSLEQAGSILDEMEQRNVSPSHDIVRNYVELLCLSGEVATATGVVKDALASNQPPLVSNKTIYRIAMANADQGHFCAARDLAYRTSEPIRTLHRNINVKEGKAA
jgi:pentatricopeptide repeat protein